MSASSIALVVIPHIDYSHYNALLPASIPFAARPSSSVLGEKALCESHQTKKFVPIKEHCIYGFCYRPNGKTTQGTRRRVCNRSSSWGEGRGSFNRTAPMAVGLSADGASYTAAHWPLSHERLLRPATTKASAKSSIIVRRQENGHLITSYSLYCIRPHFTAQHVGKRSMNGGASDIEFRTPRRQRLKVVELEVHRRPVPSQRSQQGHGDLREAPSTIVPRH